MSAFLLATLALRALLVLIGIGLCGLLTIRADRNGPREHALVDYVVGNTFAMAWYILANAEFWFFSSQLLQTFGIIVWIPLTYVSVRLLVVLLRERREGRDGQAA